MLENGIDMGSGEFKLYPGYAFRITDSEQIKIYFLIDDVIL